MTLGLCFYILMLIWLIFGIWSNWPQPQAPHVAAGSVLLFVLLLLLGWQVFGPPLR